MITKKQATRLKQLIKRYADAQEDNSWKGGGDPDDIPAIEKELRSARKALSDYIRSLTDVSEPTRP